MRLPRNHDRPATRCDARIILAHWHIRIGLSNVLRVLILERYIIYYLLIRLYYTRIQAIEEDINTDHSILEQTRDA